MNCTEFGMPNWIISYLFVINERWNSSQITRKAYCYASDMLEEQFKFDTQSSFIIAL